jgi:hypothetical protein
VHLRLAWQALIELSLSKAARLSAVGFFLQKLRNRSGVKVWTLQKAFAKLRRDVRASGYFKFIQSDGLIFFRSAPLLLSNGMRRLRTKNLG